MKIFTTSIIAVWFSITFVSVTFLSCSEIRSQENLRVQLKDGLQMAVVKENTQPTLRIILPDAQPLYNSFEVLFPEHVTIRKHGHSEAEQLYFFQPGNKGARPSWRSIDRSLEYERNFPGSIHMLARATLEEYGVRFEYVFTNRSEVEYDMVYAVTDPRLMSSIFHDVRLERTYVHHSDGFELLASETPERLIMPLDKWLPCRYLASYTWPVPNLVERRADGIIYYNKARPVDSPFIATLSEDRQWVVASFTPQFDKVGNVWSNPRLTCQHVDPQSSLLPGKQITLEVNMVIVRGSVEDAFAIAMRQRNLKK